MKERFFVATIHAANPEFEAVVWFENKEDATKEAWRRKEFYFKEHTIMGRVLNIPSKNSKKKEEP